MSDLWFSRVKLKPDAHVRAIAQLLLPDLVAPHKQKPQTLSARHKLIWSLFADDAGRSRDFLWREDSPGCVGQTRRAGMGGMFYLLSARKPENDMFEIDTKEFELRLKPGDRLYFSLRANPVVRRPHPTKTRETVSKVTGIRRTEPLCVKHDVVMRKIHGLRPADPKAGDRGARYLERDNAIKSAGREWLEDQGVAHGFGLRGVNCDGYHQMQIPRAGKPKEPLRFSMLELDGLLEVTDPGRFIEKLAQGFGSAKAYGCGLMLIRRA